MTDYWAKLNLDELELKRDKHRKDIGRLTFDCLRAKTFGDRVKCNLYPISDTDDGSMRLWAVLKGTTSSRCRQCKEFNG